MDGPLQVFKAVICYMLPNIDKKSNRLSPVDWDLSKIKAEKKQTKKIKK